MSARLQNRGFSLLEALTAVALLALSLPAILAAFGDTVSRAAHAEDRLNALARAQDLVTLARVQFRGDVETRSGSDTNFSWAINAVPSDVEGAEIRRRSSSPIAVHLTVTVRSRHGTETRLDTMFLYQEAVR